MKEEDNIVGVVRCLLFTFSMTCFTSVRHDDSRLPKHPSVVTGGIFALFQRG